MPAGRDLALLGIGLRSNFDACQQLMDRDLLGTRRFAVVRDDFEQHQVRWRRSNWHGTACKLWFCCQLHNGTLHCPSPPPAGGLHHPSPPDPLQDRMHLDCVFSIVSDNVCIMLEEMMGEASPTRRLVDEYTRGSDGAYAVSRQGVEFSQYMQDNGYHIIPISAKHQLEHRCERRIQSRPRPPLLLRLLVVAIDEVVLAFVHIIQSDLLRVGHLCGEHVAQSSSRSYLCSPVYATESLAT